MDAAGARFADLVARSHGRCLSYGIEPGRVHSARILSAAGTAARQEARRALLAAAGPFMDRLYGFVAGSGFFAVLTDEEGCILRILGDEAPMSRAADLRMVPGAFMDERSIGTNAMGTALAEGCAVQVSGAEYFVEAYRRWTCSACPVRDAAGTVVGVLDLTGDRGGVHPHTLGMVVAAADAVGRILQADRHAAELELSKLYAEAIVDSLNAGIVAVDPEGRVVAAGKRAAALFGLLDGELRSANARDLVEGWDGVLAAVREGRPFQEVDVAVKARANKLTFSLSAYPLRPEGGEEAGAVLVFKEVRKVRKLAERIVGRRAVYTFDKIVGQDPAFLAAIAFAKKAADGRSTLLVLGESGTGKELVAQAVHNFGPRRDEPFVAINCGALPRELIEAELFGYEEGAFTGAKRTGQPGKFEIADGGTLFLDEVGEMPVDLQTRLLRVLEEGTVCRVGGTRELPVDVRVVAASNKDLAAEVERGKFRADLYFRLNVLPLVLPPLRERRGDVPLLVDFFMARLSRRLNKRPVALGPDYLRELEAYPWPGNVRELENLVELVLNAEGPVALTARGGSPRSAAPSADAGGLRRPDGGALLDADLTLAELEALHVARTLRRLGGNVSAAARALGIGRTTLYRKMEELGLENCSLSEQCSDSEQA